MNLATELKSVSTNISNIYYNHTSTIYPNSITGVRVFSISSLFVRTLEDVFELEVERTKIDYESYYMDTEEVDSRFFDGFCVEDYPCVMYYHIYGYMDNDNTYWLGIIGLDTETDAIILEIILKNDEMVWQIVDGIQGI